MIYNNEDTNLNDFLFCTKKFGERPNKVVLAFIFKPIEFIKYFESISVYVNVLTEVVPDDGTNFISEKYLVELNEDMYISYLHIDKNAETGYISNVILYYKIPGDSVLSEIMADLDNMILDNEENISKINTVINTSSGLMLDSMEPMDVDYDNMNCYFNDSTIKHINKLIKKIDKTNKGIGIIYGDRGSGKTTLLNYIATTCNKTCIFISLSMIDATVNNPEFINILKEYNPLLIIDDCEVLSDNIYIKSNMAFANMLQMVEGFYSDEIDTHILLSFNVNSEEDIDNDVIKSNNLLKVIKVNSLKIDKANELCKFLGIKHKIENDTLLIDVLNENFEEDITHVGYN